MRNMNLKTWIGTAAIAVVVVGGSFAGVNVHNAQVQADAVHAASVKTAAAGAADYAVTVDAATQNAAVQQAAADAQAVIDAKAAADALAAQQAAQAAAAQAAQVAAQAAAVIVKAPVNKASVTAPSAATWVPGQAPRGTPIPTHTVTDPNAANYGQLDIMDPGLFCASHTGSGPVATATCD
jgi:hypothetical protein